MVCTDKSFLINIKKNWRWLLCLISWKWTLLKTLSWNISHISSSKQVLFSATWETAICLRENYCFATALTWTDPCIRFSPCIVDTATLHWESQEEVGWDSGCGKRKGRYHSTAALLHPYTLCRTPCDGRPLPPRLPPHYPPLRLTHPHEPPTGCPSSPERRRVGFILQSTRSHQGLCSLDIF